MFTLYRSFLDVDFCDYIANNYKSLSVHTPRDVWRAYTIKDKDVLTHIYSQFKDIIPKDYRIKWCNVTSYKDNGYLYSHKDDKSSMTIVSTITDNYTGGRFIIDETQYLDINKTDVVTFNGSEVLHGVEQVTKGERLSLNLWTSKKPSKI